MEKGEEEKVTPMVDSQSDIIDFTDTEGFDMKVFAADETDETDEVEEVKTDKKEKEKEVSDPDKTKEDDQEKSVADEDKKDPDSDDDSDEDKGSGDGEDSSPGIYSSLANVLNQEGILTSLSSDQKIEKVEDLIEAFNNELKSREYSDLTDKQKVYLDALREGIPEVEIQESLKLESELESITEDMLKNNPELRQELIKQDFIDSGMSPEKATKLAKRSVDIGEDIEDSLEALGSLKTRSSQTREQRIEAAKQAKIDARKKLDEDLKSLRTTLTKTEEIIPSMKINEQVRDKIYDQMTKPVGKVDGRPISAIEKKKIEDPINFEMKLNYLFYITNGFEDFSKIVKNSKTQAVKDLESKIKGSGFKAPGGSGNVDDDSLTDEQTKDFIQGIGEIL